VLISDKVLCIKGDFRRFGQSGGITSPTGTDHGQKYFDLISGVPNPSYKNWHFGTPPFFSASYIPLSHSIVGTQTYSIDFLPTIRST